MPNASPSAADPGVFHRHPANPILSAADVPYRATLVFNAGVAKLAGRYAMVFRNDVFEREPQLRAGETNLGLAYSDDGVRWSVEAEPCFAMASDEVRRHSLNPDKRARLIKAGAHLIAPDFSQRDMLLKLLLKE